MVHLLGALYGNETFTKLNRLNTLRQYLLQHTAQEPTPSTIKPRHGEVQRTIIKVLEEAQTPMSVRQVRAAVEQSLNHPVAKSTVGNCLATQSIGNNPLFKKVKRGWYSDATS